jgi:hypothetical protein
MEHQCKRLGVFDNKNTSEIIREALFEYLEQKVFPCSLLPHLEQNIISILI